MKKIQANDSFQRINYLYQISKHLAEKNPALSSYYGHLIVNVAKKNVLKINTSSVTLPVMSPRSVVKNYHLVRAGEKTEVLHLMCGQHIKCNTSLYNIRELEDSVGQELPFGTGVGKKRKFKRHPNIKRQICKKCRVMLVDKKTARMKIKTKSNVKVIEWSCSTCRHKRSFPASKNKDHSVWLEKPEAVEAVVIS